LLAQEKMDITLQIRNLQNHKGQLAIAIYKDRQSYKEEKPFQSHLIPKKNLNLAEVKLTFSLLPGKYGFAVIDDENMDAKMNRNFIGYPLEGFGFSALTMNYVRRPSFEEFCVELNEPGSLVQIDCIYSSFYR
jgi:uncharacterized protein (DUF2141 family)